MNELYLVKSLVLLVLFMQNVVEKIPTTYCSDY